MNGDADRSRLLGRALMAGAVLQLLVFVIGLSRRSYLVLALPVGLGLGLVSALAFWVGYTMAYAQWDDEDFDAPDPESLASSHEAATAAPVEPPAPFEPPAPPAPPAPADSAKAVDPFGAGG